LSFREAKKIEGESLNTPKVAAYRAINAPGEAAVLCDDRGVARRARAKLRKSKTS
jgi:hypothetical protein